jgi:hypothetical protein
VAKPISKTKAVFAKLKLTFCLTSLNKKHSQKKILMATSGFLFCALWRDAVLLPNE